MKPIAQTFYVNEPENGVAGVYLTSVDLYFKSKSPTFGVQVQIRQTDNGNPTKFVMPHADITKSSSLVDVSDDASVATKFTFQAPVFLQNLTSYAIVIIPVGGNPDYQIWTSELAPGTVDVTTNSPIKTNNDTGTLFISSNDTQFTAIQTEDIKFNLYVAKFKNTTGKAVFTPLDSDYMRGKDKIGNFYSKEISVVSNNSFDLAKLNITSNTGAFINNELVFQSNGSANVATGIIYSANTTSIKITNSNGTWVTNYQIRGNTSHANGVIATSGVFMNVVTTEGSNTITVPFTNNISNGQMIYVGTNSRSYMQPSIVTSIINGTTLQLKQSVNFSENDAMYGRVRGDGSLYGSVVIVDEPFNPNYISFILDDVTSNTTINFTGIRGKYLMGVQSGASLKVISTYNSSYNTIVPQFAESKPNQTDTNWSFVGSASSDKTMDIDPISLINNVERELYDYPRSLMSRSNEYAQLTGTQKGESTIKIYADMSTTNNYVSPIIDYASRVGTFLSNQVVPAEQLNGYRISMEDNPFSNGNIVMQQNTASGFISGTGTVIDTTANTITVAYVNGYFTNVNSIMLSTDINVNSIVTDSSHYSERYNSNYTYASRYISKSVVLAEGQDAEDLRVYLTAYRPATTDFLVYGRFQNSNDPTNFQTKNWTLLSQISSPSLLSSTVNKQDFVELEYSVSKSIELFPDSCYCNSTSNMVTVRSTDDIKKDDFVYFADTQSGNFFVNRVKLVSTANKQNFYLRTNPPFNISNSSFGVIPLMEISSGAFIYSRTGILRYVSQIGTVYESFKTFAVKIVPVAESSALVPRAKDMRAIALQV
jgi:hypothetical protein